MDIKKIAYELYKLNWINVHIPIARQLATYREYIVEQEEDYDDNYTYEDFLFDNGFQGELYADFEEFLENEYMDKEYMRYLLDNSIFWKRYLEVIKDYKNLRKQYSYEGMGSKFLKGGGEGAGAAFLRGIK